MQDITPRTIAFGIALVLFVIVSGITFMQMRSINTLNANVKSLTERIAYNEEALSSLDERFRANIQTVRTQNTELAAQITEEKKRIDALSENVHDFDRNVDRLSDSLDTLEKLTTTDPQLLQKYSRVYFLNEHYIPADLTVIDEEYDYPNGKEVSVLTEMWPYLKRLLEDAKDDGIDIMVLSGYRSFKEQSTLKQNYLVHYGTGANQFSADQGYSEHQLGTAVDFTTKTLGENIDNFGSTEAFEWLKDNAYKYGFIMSYPEGNEYYVYEPWHWRFVGKKLARYLHRKNENFYDLDQRKIDEYLPYLFE